MKGFALEFKQLVISLLIGLQALQIWADSPFKKFEYKYSFKPPYLAQKDGTVPFFTHSGNAIASEENLRVTPSLRSQKGAIWSKLQTSFEWWEVELVFRVTGRGRIGADGLAFWFTESVGVEGPVFGSNDQWKGLGIFFDSFDNDNKHNNPYIMAMVNDGAKQYDHHNDGSTQQLAGCLRDFRNKPFPVRAKIQYYQNILVIMFNNGMSNNENDFELCLRAENVFLPPRGYFGASAATGGLADDHDVQKFMTWSLTLEQAGLTQNSGVPNAEQQKFEQEFQNYQQELNKKKEEYIKDHPEAQKEKENEDDWFEEENLRELRQIFTGQSEIRGMVQGLARKLDEIVGRQENTNSLITNSFQNPQFQQQQHIPPAPAGQVPVQQIAVQSTIQRHEVDNILAASRELVASTREIKNLLVSISTKQDQANARPGSYGNVDISASVNELRDGMNVVKRDIGVVSQRVHSMPTGNAGGPGECPTVSCVSSGLFIGMAVFQIVLVAGYTYYKNSKESQSKKFY